METKFQTSFIPKKPIVEQESSSLSPFSNFSLFFGLSLLVFLIVLGGWGAVFFYKGYISQSIKSNQEFLTKAQNQFDPELFAEVKRFSDKINISKNILDNHIVSSRIFEFLEEITLKKVRFSSMQYSLTEKGANVFLRGEAESFGALAKQSDFLIKEKHIAKQAIISNISVVDDGSVSFDLSFYIDTGDLKYSNMFKDINVDSEVKIKTENTNKDKELDLNNNNKK